MPNDSSLPHLCGGGHVQKQKRYRARVYNADESQLLALRRLARSTEDGESVSALIRTAIAEYIARHTGKNVSLPFGSEGGVRKRAGSHDEPKTNRRGMFSAEALANVEPGDDATEDVVRCERGGSPDRNERSLGRRGGQRQADAVHPGDRGRLVPRLVSGRP
jgi:hypothetical protein